METDGQDPATTNNQPESTQSTPKHAGGRPKGAKTQRLPTERKETFKELIVSGVEPKRAASIVGYSQSNAYALARLVKKHGLMHPKKIKAASSAVDAALEDPDNKVKLVAAKMVYDRLQPIVNQPIIPPSSNFVQINISKLEDAARVLGPSAVDNLKAIGSELASKASDDHNI